MWGCRARLVTHRQYHSISSMHKCVMESEGAEAATGSRCRERWGFGMQVHRCCWLSSVLPLSPPWLHHLSAFGDLDYLVLHDQLPYSPGQMYLSVSSQRAEYLLRDSSWSLLPKGASCTCTSLGFCRNADEFASESPDSPQSYVLNHLIQLPMATDCSSPAACGTVALFSGPGKYPVKTHRTEMAASL